MLLVVHLELDVPGHQWTRSMIDLIRNLSWRTLPITDGTKPKGFFPEFMP